MSADPNAIGLRIRKLRKRLGLSLRDLAGRTGLTASFLSQVERGKTNTSIDSLRRIAEALDVSMLYFLSETPQTNGLDPAKVEAVEMPDVSPKYNPVVRAGGRSKLILPDSGVTYELLTPGLAHKMEVISGRISPGVGNVARLLREPTEEWIYVLYGALLVELEVDAEIQAYVLNAGDAIYFEGQTLRGLSCASDEETSWISVITPPVF